MSRGHLNIAKLMISKGANNFVESMSYACWGGQMEIIKFLIEKYPNTSFDWNYSLGSACKGGHIDVIKFLLEKGHSSINEFNEPMGEACEGGHLDIVKFMIIKGATHWDFGLRCACFGGHLDIVKFMIAKGAKDWNFGMRCAREEGHFQIMKFLIVESSKHNICLQSQYIDEKLANSLSFSELKQFISLKFLPLIFLKTIRYKIYVIIQLHSENMFPVLKRFQK